MARSVQERRREILQLLAEASPRRLSDLSHLLSVSPVTLRRDVEDLAAQGRLRRTHGEVSALSDEDRAGRGLPFTVGIVVPHAEYYFGAVIHGARAAAASASAGARLTLGVSAYDLPIERRLVAGLIERGVDGLLIAPTPDFETGELSDPVQAWLASIPVPVVLVERPVAPGGRASMLDGVGSAHSVGSASAVRHLADLGHQKLAFVAISGPNTAHVRDGYRRGIAGSAATSLAELYEDLADPAALDGELKRLVDDGVTGLVVHNDQLALRLLGRFDGLGLRVPEDLSLVCYDDISAELAQPALTAVAPQKAAVGRRAFQLLAERIAQRAAGEQPTGAERVQLVPLLHERSSTRPLR
ncbi:LacI family DNA-binding transcriptional regulator [Antribacter gilvus]|uniref:LacI family DNA-binding transcriptional regulator n=1 Tax=Antribacter gilvus TaxID=2304675 RepID=UPI00197FA80E|nr:LacI family DNA-binding transcriptional regulator [Antribacter gilvus]